MRGKFKIKLLTEHGNECLFEGVGDERYGLVEACRAYLEHARIHAASWPIGIARSLRVTKAKTERLIQQTFEWSNVPALGASYVSIERLYL